MAQTEKDTIDVISFLKHEDEKKNAQVEFAKKIFLKVFLLNAFLIVMFWIKVDAAEFFLLALPEYSLGNDIWSFV